MWWFLLALVSCHSSPGLPAYTAPIRLIQVFDDAHWIQAPAATPAPERVFHDSFEQDDLSAWTSKRKDRSPLSRVEEGTDGHWALAIAAGEKDRYLPALFRTVTVQGDRTYRISAQLKTEDLGAPGRTSQGATFSLIERTRDGVVLHIDTLPRLRGDTPWRTLSTTIRTNPDTRELEVHLVPAIGKTGGRVLYDDVALDLLDPQAELSRLPAWTEYARPLSHPNVRGVTLGPDFRPAIVHPTPASWGFTVDVPDSGAHLRFAWALGPDSMDKTQVCFSVGWADRRVGGELWRDCTKGLRGRRWTDVDVPLDQDGTLVFKATSNQPERIGHVLWGDVRVETVTPAERPNVALIVIDTLRADHLGSYGYADRPSSPELDAFATRALRFATARSVSPWTAPGLGTVVTGRLPSEHRAGTRVLHEVEVTRESAGQSRKNQLNYTGLSLDYISMAEVFAAAGYETVGFQSNFFYGPALGFARGMGRTIRYKGSSLQGARGGLDLVRDWLTERDDSQPFFLSAHFIDPHMPYRMRRPWAEGFSPPESLEGVDFDRSKPALVLRRFTEENRDQTDAIETIYDAEIRWVDQALGELLPMLEARDTLVVVLSDHGEAFDEHGKFSHGHGLYDELLRVPLLIRLPDGSRAGTVDTRQASLLDVLPTVLKQAGLPVPEHSRGMDLLAPPPAQRSPLILEGMYSGLDRTGLLEGDWKYIYTHPQGYLGFHRAGVKPSGSAHNAREELFDLATDPGELSDRSSAEPERLAAMRAQVHDWLQRSWPAMHLRCQGVTSTIVLESSETVGQISPFSVEPTDRVVLDKTRHRISLDLVDDEDWLAIRFLQSGATVTVDGTSWVLDSGSMPTSPPAPGPGCQVWEVPLSGGETQDLDDETFAELEALGYIE